jgi:integrase
MPAGGYLDRVPDIELPKAPRGRTRFFNKNEITRLFEACARSKNKHLPAMVALAIHTGMRKSEILGLKWERIELDKTPGNTHIRLYDTKNGEARGVPLSQDAVAALTALEENSTKRIGSVVQAREWRGLGTNSDRV